MSKKVQINVKEDLKQEEKLIAVMLLETYSENFRPFSLKKAECLLPLIGGKTQLDRNIEYLIANKIEEIYLFCTSHSGQVKAYLTEERLKSWRSQGCEIHFLYNFKCQSVGDAMREIDAKGLVRSNFILVTASTIIGNTKLDEYLERHKIVSKLDKNCIMTMLCQDKTNDLPYNSSLNETSFASHSNTVIIHNANNKIMHYDLVKQNSHNKRASKYLNLPAEMFQNAYRTSGKQITLPQTQEALLKFKKSSESDIAVQSMSGTKMNSIQHLNTIQQRNDLIESGIFLCSPYVLHMFTDNFDYDNMADYMRGVLVEEEVAGYTCYIDVIHKKFNLHYSMINNINTYYFETMRIIQRIDLILNEKEISTYRRLPDRINAYISENHVTVGPNLKLTKNCMIDSKCQLGANCELVNCFIGSNCKLGDNVKLSNCIVWPNTQIGNNSVINASFIGSNVRIGNDCSVCENCLIAGDCHVKDNTKFTVRGVYTTRKDIQPLKASETPSGFSVLQDNYTKYFMNYKSIEESNESDDDFGSIDGDDELEDNASTEESDEDNDDEENDTSKNNQFYVWKTRSRKVEVQNRLRRNSEESVSSSTSTHSVLSAESSDEFERDSESEEYDEFADENEDNANNDNTHVNKIGDEDQENFLSETIEILKRGLNKNLNADNLILEINSCKHANNIVIDDLCYLLTKSIFNLPIVMNTSQELTPQEYLTAFKTFAKKQIGTLLENYYTSTKQSQKIFLDSALDFFVEMKQIGRVSSIENIYVKILHFLFNDIEVLNENAVINWYEEKLEKFTAEKETKSTELMLEIIKKLEPFIDWLRESDDEEDDSEEDED